MTVAVSAPSGSMTALTPLIATPTHDYKFCLNYHASILKLRIGDPSPEINKGAGEHPSAFPMDTGLCVPETIATLTAQQMQLLAGKRPVQMFPIGTTELRLPVGFARHQNTRGVFHFRPDAISAEAIEALSAEGRENEFLMLGPFGKPEIAKRLLAGESLVCVTEYSPEGVEIRSAAGTETTIDEQREYFERTREPGNVIVVGEMPPVIRARLERQ